MPERFSFDDAGLRALLDSPAGPVAKELTRRTLSVERGAKRLAPVDTGRLRSSVTHEVGADAQGLVGVIGTDVEYAPYVELGTSKARAQPFLRPALAAEVGR